MAMEGVKHKRSTSIWTCFLIYLYVVIQRGGKSYHPLRACSRTGTKINKLTIDKIDARSKSRNQVYLGYALQAMFEEDPNLMNIGKEIGEGLFMQTYSRFLNFYRTDASTRYKQLLQRCPNIVQQLPLQEIASYLRVTPTTVSKIRKELLG